MVKNDTQQPSWQQGLMALSPLFFFCALYLSLGIISGDFYATPITATFAATCIYALLTTRHSTVQERIDMLSRGAGQPGILLMIWIFVLAGAFAAIAKQIGAIDATVSLALHLLPDNMILAGLFLASCFISLSMGTSVGTIAALVPIAQGMSAQTDVPLAELVGLVVGGAYFGDNLSFISDTTIMATRTQGCRMKDKFLVNAQIVVPAALLVLVLYICMGADTHVTAGSRPVNLWLVLPYLTVLATAIAGIDVMLVLLLGIALCFVIGLTAADGGNAILLFQSLGTGIMGMAELIIVTLLAAGLMELVRHNGGIAYIVSGITRHVRTKRMAELSIGALVFLVNLCTANNTISILTVGPIAREIATTCQVDARKTASLLDTFSCLSQSLLPYGAQLLIAAGLAAISPMEVIPYLYYPFVMGLFALLAIAFRFPKKYS